ncbi:MAG TPA: DeoR/GlpR transcriptional regulator [Thermoflexia bacterium]|jgi:DeoR/GlpR family transcriptional regulator of sugar metabolism|nr:DeoR/GlpR transcriptional regulator [Thermoflexia bacterium]
MESGEGRQTARRRAAILRLLNERGSVRVVDLEALFGVSAPTVRRDLAWLTQQGLARRVRGGAVAVGAEPSAPLGPIAARIGRAAAQMVQEGETIFLGPGRLTLALAHALDGIGRLTVVTNGLEVAQAVARNTSYTLILTGGQLNRSEGGLEGPLARASLEGLRADRVFLELSGIDALEGLTDDSLSQAELARLLLGLAAQRVVLVDPERVGRVAAAYIGPASEADVVVTAREADSAPLWDLAEAGVKVVLA